MTINFVDLFASLDMMWKGMAGLFAVCGFIMVLTMLIHSVFRTRRKPR